MSGVAAVIAVICVSNILVVFLVCMRGPYSPLGVGSSSAGDQLWWVARAPYAPYWRETRANAVHNSGRLFLSGIIDTDMCVPHTNFRSPYA